MNMLIMILSVSLFLGCNPFSNSSDEELPTEPIVNSGNDLARNKYFGPVKTYSNIICDSTGTDCYTQTALTYTTTGFLKEMIMYKNTGEMIDRMVNEYNENNFKNQQLHYDSEGSLMRTVNMSYDSFGSRIKTETFTSSGTLIYLSISENDVAGNVLESKSLSPSDSSILSYTKYEYIPSFAPLNVFTYSLETDTTIPVYNYYKKDADGNILEEIKLKKGIIDNWESFEYDGFGSEIKHNSHNDDGSISYSGYNLFKYDAENNIIEESTLIDTSIFMTQYNIYDDYQNAKEQKFIYHSTNRTVKNNFEYKYDYHFNWIEKMTFVNDTIQFINKREFTYY